MNESTIRRQYLDFVEEAIESYKASIPRSELLRLADEVVAELAHLAGQRQLTELLLIEQVDRKVFSLLRLPAYQDWRETHGVSTISHPAPVVGPDGAPINLEAISTRPLITAASAIGDALLADLARNPERVLALTPRQFEELVAELLARQGLRVSLTRATRDGGKDLIVAVESMLGSFVHYVECKQYAPNRPVGVSLVRELYGIVQADRVTSGVLVTTSTFTADASAFQKQVPHQLGLKAYADLREWITNTHRQHRGGFGRDRE